MSKKKKVAKKRGRPKSNGPDPKIAKEILCRLSDGESLRSICRSDGMPVPSTVLEWTRQHDDFFEQYAKARQLGYELMADEILDIADDGTNDYLKTQVDVDDSGNPVEVESFNSEHMQRSRLRVDTRKWMLSKVLPKVYGDKVEHTGKDGRAIEVDNKWTVEFVNADTESK